MNYDVQIGNTIRRGLTYAELIECPIGPNTFIRRGDVKWIQAKDCIELTHILPQASSCQPVHTVTIAQNETDDYYQDGYDEEIDYYKNEKNEVVETSWRTPRSLSSPASPDYSYCNQDDVDEELIFIPTAEYFKCKQKRKASIIGVCTLGLAGLSLMGVGNTWRSNIFAGTSFSENSGIGFVFKCLSFCFLTALIAIPYFIYSVFALIYYSIRLHNLKR